MSGGRRWALVALAVAVIVGGFVIARSGGDDNGKSTAPVATGGGGSRPAPVFRVVVQHGKPAGGVHKIVVKKGDRVRFDVVSDVADEVHLHGYDLHRDVAKGGTVRFDFKATIDGDFEAELESRKEQILDLVVEP